MNRNLSFICFILLFFQFTFSQESKTITGIVSDEYGIPLPSATVIVQGSSEGTSTDFDGNFTLETTVGALLEISFVGYEQYLVEVTDNEDTYSVQLVPNNALDEVVVIGYGKQTKRKIIQNVATISSDAIENLQVNSPGQLLQGLSSGVQVVNSSGVIGSATVIRVRGSNSINSGSQPLVVLDGVPLTDSDSTFGLGGNVGINPLAYINPNDIETFTILKDAGATSIYGSRGANGVILITTKKGKKNTDATVTIDTNVQLTQATDLPEVLTADQFRTFRSDIATLQNRFLVTPESLNLGNVGDPGTDWLSRVLRNGITQNYSLNAKGGNEKTSYFIGLEYQNIKNFIIGNNSQKVATRINIESDVKEWFRLGLNLSYTDFNLDRVGVEDDFEAPFTNAIIQNPTFLPYTNGELNPSFTAIPNILGVVDLNTNELKTAKVVGNVYGEIDLYEGLIFRSEYGIDRLNLEEFIRSANLNTPGGEAEQLLSNEERWLTNQLLTYSNGFDNGSSLNVTLGLNYEQTLRTLLYVNGTGFLNDSLRNLQSAANVNVGEGNRIPTRLYGLFSRVSYDYKQKYLVEGSIRRDGSSRFGANNRFGIFWSTSAGWILTQEDFLKESKTINYLAFRGSIGVVGNDRLGAFPSLGLYSAGALGDYNGQSGITPAQPENRELKWEESETIDFGIKSSFFNNRLSFDINYFKRITRDLLLNQLLPPQTGFSSVALNVGEIQNQGIEIDLKTVNIDIENFRWTTNFNITFIKNRVNRLNEDAPKDREGRRIIPGANQRAIEGLPLNNFYLVRYVGVNPATGDAEWLDAEGNITLNPTSDDRVIVGSPLPKFSGGIVNNFTFFKQINLYILANYSYGNDIYLDNLRLSDGVDAIGGIANVRVNNLNYWRQPGDVAFLPSPSSETFNRFNQRSDLQLFDGSYLRIKNITLSYSLPKSLIEKNNIISSIDFYATATNLFTLKGKELKGIDPEVTNDISPRFQGESFFTIPQAKSYLIGTRVNF